ncbi:hypothetical protein MMC25_008228 [Agyrium rufum]|nr:hypothetical protein [Agyrium rufum]
MPILNLLRSKTNRNKAKLDTSSPTSSSGSPMSPKYRDFSPFSPSSSSGGSPLDPYQPSPATRRPPPNQLSASEMSDAPPPAYQPFITTATDDPFAFLSTFDTVFLIDDSGSMAGASWRQTGEAIAAITPICTSHDTNGIDIYFLNHTDSSEYKNLKAATDVQAVFQSVRPYGGTPTGTKLNAILKPYLVELEKKGVEKVKPLNIIVITDGVPSDDVESVIINVAKKLDKFDAPAWQVGIQFFQVGHEAGAAEALSELDDALVEMAGVRDIVDTVPWKSQKTTSAGGSGLEGLNAQGILKVVLGAVTRRLDRKKDSVEWRK